ncbi:DUF554 domain-containing protein [Paenibacillus rigui]|uniref:DUF554 domain-containing protein n=1 Tax=Paenibacillus rigui TaxID=554312 RepID=A0A229UNL1_9BACL|nr:DUF554 domain-containing protein [Paenibacillus rigui]OXM84905.1 hypothetical protein CF651_18560 [Paenibacillus rigui]
MALWGTIVNAAAIIAGGLLGLMLNKMSQGIRNTVMQGIGLALVVLGLSMALKSSNFLLVVASLVIGGIAGELLRIEQRLERLGGRLEQAVEAFSRLGRSRKRRCSQESPEQKPEAALGQAQKEQAAGAERPREGVVLSAGSAAAAPKQTEQTERAEPVKEQGRIARAFVNTTLIYCVGAMAILGALDGGLRGQHDILYTKAMLDGFTAIIFASTMGVGVLFSSLPVLLYQGVIALGASGIASLIQQELLNEIIVQITAVGGILITGIGINLLEIRKINVANLLPSLLVAALAVVLIQS